MKNPPGSTFFMPPPGGGLPLYWNGMGEEIQRTTDYRWHGLRRESYTRLLWQLTLSGEGMIEIGSHPPVAMHRGEGFLARIPSDHCYYYRAGSPAWRFIWVIWSGPAIGAIADALMGRSPVRLIRMRPEVAEMRTLRSLIRLGEETTGDSTRSSLDAYRMLLAVCQASSENTAGSPRTARTVAQVEKMLRHEPGSAVGKEGLSARLGLSRFQLYRALKQELGISPHEWTARERINRACHLLKTTRRSIAEIAIDSGVPDSNYFARFFRMRTGFTPREWRRLFGGTKEDGSLPARAKGLRARPGNK